MPSSTPKSIATLEDSPSGETARAVGLLQDRFAERAHRTGALTAVCFTALAGSVGRSSEDANLPLFTFLTHNGKSLQIAISPKIAREFAVELVASIPGAIEALRAAGVRYPRRCYRERGASNFPS
jgi:hypothetical protein